ncbi:MAG: hypothetical protein HOH74_18890, partial [Gemmatimonadetes bacterium]|nr:hypothetical protein [Gemmatimonadota bacterium]
MNRWRRLHLCSLTLLCLALAPASHAQPALQEGAEFYLSGPCHFVDPAPAATWALVNLISLNEESRLTCRNMNGRDGATGESTEIAKFRVEKVGDDNQYKLSANGKFLRRGPPTADSNTHNTVLADVTGDDEAPWFRVSPNYGYNVVRVWADLWRGVQFDPGAYAWKQGRDSGSGDLVSFPGDLTYHFRIHFPSDAVLWRDDVAKVPSKVLNVAGRLLVVKYSSKGFLYRYVKEIAAADPPTSTSTGYTF